MGERNFARIRTNIDRESRDYNWDFELLETLQTKEIQDY